MLKNFNILLLKSPLKNLISCGLFALICSKAVFNILLIIVHTEGKNKAGRGFERGFQYLNELILIKPVPLGSGFLLYILQRGGDLI